MDVLKLSASLYVILNQFNVDRGAFFLPEARRAFCCFHSALFLLTGSMTVKNHTEADM